MSAGRKNNSDAKSWNTPTKILNYVRKFFGQIDLDPCSNEHSIVNAEIEYILPQDGLVLDWLGNVFCNPPYGRNPENKTTLLNWINKAQITFAALENEIIFLIPVATNTRHFKQIFNSAQAICFLADTRLKFWINGREDKKGAPMACCLVYWGKDKEGFKEIFQELGHTLYV